MAVATAIMWVIVGARWVWGRGDDRASLRGKMTVALTWLSVAVTMLTLSGHLDRWLHAPNLSAALRRIAVGIAWLVAQDFMQLILQAHGGRASDSAVRLRALSRAGTWTMMACAVLLWLFALPHDHELDVLNADPSDATTWLLLSTYVWIMGICGSMVFIGVRAAVSRAMDLPGHVFGTLMGISGTIGFLGGLSLSLTRLIAPGTTFDVEHGLALPLMGAFSTVAIASVPVVEWWQARRSALREVKRLTPEWTSATQRHPEVVLHLPRVVRWMSVPVVAERMRIELLDAAAADEKDRLSGP